MVPRFWNSALNQLVIYFPGKAAGVIDAAPYTEFLTPRRSPFVRALHLARALHEQQTRFVHTSKTSENAPISPNKRADDFVTPPRCHAQSPRCAQSAESRNRTHNALPEPNRLARHSFSACPSTSCRRLRYLASRAS